MNKLVLFDIDGTLVKSIPDNPHAKAFTQSIDNLYGIKTELDWEKVAGLTDRLIFIQLLEDTGWDSNKINQEMPRLIRELERVYVDNFKSGSVEKMPGVNNMLRILKEKQLKLGLLTGNLAKIAEIKLTDAGIYHYFELGGYGSDEHLVRSELVEIASKRSGMQNNLENIYLIGDTPRDILAAIDAGVYNAIGYSASHHGKDALRSSGAKAIINSFDNWEEVKLALDI